MFSNDLTPTTLADTNSLDDLVVASSEQRTVFFDAFRYLYSL